MSLSKAALPHFPSPRPARTPRISPIGWHHAIETFHRPHPPLYKRHVGTTDVLLDSRPLKMGEIRCLETSVRNHHYFLRNNQEERSFQNWYYLIYMCDVIHSSSDYVLSNNEKSNEKWLEWEVDRIRNCPLWPKLTVLAWGSLKTTNNLSHVILRSGWDSYCQIPELKRGAISPKSVGSF